MPLKEKHCPDQNCDCVKPRCGYLSLAKCQKLDLFNGVYSITRAKFTVKQACFRSPTDALANVFLALKDYGVVIEGSCINYDPKLCRFFVSIVTCQGDELTQALNDPDLVQIGEHKEIGGALVLVSEQDFPHGIYEKVIESLGCLEVCLLESYFISSVFHALMIHTNDDNLAALLFRENGIDGPYCREPESEP